MPAGSEDEVQATGPGGSIMDQVAKESKDSTASSHSLHDDKHVDGSKATVQDHKANPGPVISQQDLGEPASKEESRKRAAELNKE